MLIAQRVTRRFGYRTVVDEVSLQLESGDGVLLLGHNGAGKTTLLRLLAGLLRPSSGTVSRTGTMGMVAHQSMLYDVLTARENLSFAARLHGSPDASRIDQVLERLGLMQYADRRVGTFSRGMTQRLAIARALLPDPDLLLMDEPLTGLDPDGSAIACQLFADLRSQGKAVLISTHQIAELVGLVGSVAYLVGGKLAAFEPVNGRDCTAVTERYREVASG
ncbi:MAG: ATP-binding cassette domain-containing protein [Gemmatimonadales bacterium]